PTNELKSLDQLGISAINLRSTSQVGPHLDDNGMEIVTSSTFTSHGQTSDLKVVRLAYNPADAAQQLGTVAGAANIMAKGPTEGLLVQRDGHELDDGHNTKLDGLLHNVPGGAIETSLDAYTLTASSDAALWSTLGVWKDTNGNGQIDG